MDVPPQINFFKFDPPLETQIEEYHVLDFSRWRDNESFGRMYRRLVEGLNLFYQGEGT